MPPSGRKWSDIACYRAAGTGDQVVYIHEYPVWLSKKGNARRQFIRARSWHVVAEATVGVSGPDPSGLTSRPGGGPQAPAPRSTGSAPPSANQCNGPSTRLFAMQRAIDFVRPGG